MNRDRLDPSKSLRLKTIRMISNVGGRSDCKELEKASQDETFVYDPLADQDGMPSAEFVVKVSRNQKDESDCVRSNGEFSKRILPRLKNIQGKEQDFWELFEKARRKPPMTVEEL